MILFTMLTDALFESLMFRVVVFSLLVRGSEFRLDYLSDVHNPLYVLRGRPYFRLSLRIAAVRCIFHIRGLPHESETNSMTEGREKSSDCIRINVETTWSS